MHTSSLPPFSVLMAVYHRDVATYFRESLHSVFNQTHKPDQVVLVCDGGLTASLNEVIAEYSQEYPELLQVIRKESNEGLGLALDLGLQYCKYDLIARMDSDDISMPERFATQVSFLQNHPEIDVVSCAVKEFEDNPQQVISVRTLPASGEKLRDFARKRNPINHPASMFRKQALTAVGGYQHCLFFEDYHLAARLLMAGYNIYNSPEPLYYFRLTPDTYHRRRGWKYLYKELSLQNEFRKMGFVSFPQFMRNIAIRIPVRLLPWTLLKSIYLGFLR